MKNDWSDDMAATTNHMKITEEKVWMKYYSEEAQKVELPHSKAFDYVMEINSDRLDQPALHYFGRDISFLDLNSRVNKAAKAFTALGVKEGDIVSFLSASIPETIAAVYALNKLGAAANTIDPRLDIKSIEKMIVDSGSKLLITIDIAFPKVKMIMDNLK